ncbi:hypothetical protein V8E54_004734 [Elaphomyces granulatus]
MSNPKDYTVGWICAIVTEYVAAQAFLDIEHDRPEKLHSGDNNDYTLGEIGGHNIVIATLPGGEYGISSAATVARDMLHSFPNIRFGLMVGIGGGAPSQKHDIRLGDIVVSTSREGAGSVFQYDFGKTIQGQNFCPTGYLNQPPPILRTAVAGLEAQYERKGHRIEEEINSILEKNKRMRRKYKRPDSESDRLHQSQVPHPPNNEEICARSCGNDASKLIIRPERTEDEDNPMVHYGLIASGNKLIKDAPLRDVLIAEKDVLCFEMEAAGLMNHFPCLVIRGICDYSDSHENKEWQGYAAMAAAAYTKDLLCRIVPQQVEAERKISEILFDIQESLHSVSRNIDKVLHRQHDREQQAILDWLTSVDYFPQQNDFIGRRQEGTGEWLVESDEFQHWENNKKCILFCPGIPGSGKTMMVSIVVDHLFKKFRNDPGIGIAFLYFNFRQQQDQRLIDLFLSLLKQFSQRQPLLPECVTRMYKAHERDRTRPSFSEISDALYSVIVNCSRAFIIIDALDECLATDRVLSQFMEELFRLQAKTGSSLIATSRPILGIPQEFERRGSSILEIRASDEDMRRYLDGHVNQISTFVREAPGIERKIKSTILKAADGMFLLARLHLDSLEDKISVMEVEDALEKLPKGEYAYRQAYDEAMEKRIKGQKPSFSDLALRTLSWITFSKRLLTTSELQHALAVTDGSSTFDRRNLTHINLITSVCAGLVIVDEGDDIIRLVHYTTQEYFDQTWATWFPNGQTDIAKTCVTYLSFKAFETGTCHTDEDFKARLQSNILYDYAARNWGHHARISSIEGGKLILNFLESTAKASASSQAMMYTEDVLWQMKGIHLAAYFGLQESMSALLDKNADVESKNCDLSKGICRTPLLWAAENGHEAVVKLLLDKNADTESEALGETPLSLAAEKGHEAVVNLLLDKNAGTESKDDFGRTPLSWASENGHEAVVKLLLDKRADIEFKTNIHGLTPLSLAAENGHE